MFTERDRRKCNELYERYYAGRKFHDTHYREAIRRHLKPGQRVLDAGCGRYLRFCRDLSDVATVFGVDLDELDTSNRVAPYGVRANIGRLPFPDGHFDMVISRSVVEHLTDPLQVFSEISRVLRPGGTFVVITPNKLDYVSVIAALTPYRLHRALVSRIFRVPEDDVFPTLYRANTIGAIRRVLRAAGLFEKELEMINHYPAYLMFSPVLFRFGVLYERLTSLRLFRFLRGSILCVYEKAGAAPAMAARHGEPVAAMHTGVS